MFEFIFQIDIMQLEILRLPITRLMLENSCFLLQGESVHAWPLVCDPTSRVIDWLRKKMGKNLVEVRYSVSIGLIIDNVMTLNAVAGENLSSLSILAIS